MIKTMFAKVYARASMKAGFQVDPIILMLFAISEEISILSRQKYTYPHRKSFKNYFLFL